MRITGLALRTMISACLSRASGAYNRLLVLRMGLALRYATGLVCFPCALRAYHGPRVAYHGFLRSVSRAWRAYFTDLAREFAEKRRSCRGRSKKMRLG